MNGLSAAQSGVVTGYRSAAHVIAGLGLFGVLGLLLHLVGAEAVGWSHLSRNPFAAGALLVVAAYPAGRIVDGVATRLWARIGRKWNNTDALRDWHAIRTRHPTEGEPRHREADLRDAPTWRAAQHWIWSSSEAAAELGDLRVRLMLGKDMALDAALTVAVAAAAPLLCDPSGRRDRPALLVPVRPGSRDRGLPLVRSRVDPDAPGQGGRLEEALGWILTHPGKEGDWRRPPRREADISARWTAFTLLLVASDAVWSVWVCLTAPDLFSVPNDLFWLVGVVALGPLVVFAFAYVRIEANRMYHGLIQEAAKIGRP